MIRSFFKNKIHIFYVTIVVMMLAVGIYLYSSLCECQMINDKSQSFFNKYFNLIRLVELETDDSSFQPSLSDKRDSLTFVKEFLDGPVLCLYYNPYRSCRSCVEILAKRMDILNEENRCKVVFLSRYDRSRDAFFFKKTNKLVSNVYNLDSLNLKAEKLECPISFVVVNGKSKNFFTPDKNDMESFEQYLQIVSEKYEF